MVASGRDRTSWSSLGPTIGCPLFSGTEGSGVQRVEAVYSGEVEPAKLSILPVKFFGGIVAIGSGLA